MNWNSKLTSTSCVRSVGNLTTNAFFMNASYQKSVQQHVRGPTIKMSHSQIHNYSPCFDGRRFVQEQLVAWVEKHSKIDADDVTDVVPCHNSHAKWQRHDIQMWQGKSHRNNRKVCSCKTCRSADQCAPLSSTMLWWCKAVCGLRYLSLA